MWHGHDLNDLLDNYTMEQLELMSQALWQHSMTVMGVVAYALGGQAAADRMPEAAASQGRDYSEEWAETGARWNIARRDADGNLVPVAPRHSPEEEERRKSMALRKLFGVQAAADEAYGAGRGRRRRKGRAASPAAPDAKDGPVSPPGSDADAAIERLMGDLRRVRGEDDDSGSGG